MRAKVTPGIVTWMMLRSSTPDAVVLTLGDELIFPGDRKAGSALRADALPMFLLTAQKPQLAIPAPGHLRGGLLEDVLSLMAVSNISGLEQEGNVCADQGCTPRGASTR
jgi:hypothetical protein